MVIGFRMGFLYDNEPDYLKVNTFINCDNPLFILLKQMSFVDTSKDVIMHLRSLFGFKSDAVPGRLNQFLVTLIDRYLLWTMLELCGVNHAFMPLQIISFKF
jgi:hypothetical protein